MPKTFETEVEYTEEIDQFLVSIVGYPLLSSFISDIFISSYSVTSIEEYFSCGFEEYFAGKNIPLQNICPVLYDKINYLEMNLENLNV